MARTALFVLLTGLALAPGCDGRRDRGPGRSDGAVARDGAAAGDAASTDTGPSTGGRAIGEPCAVDADCTEPPDAECFTTIGGGPVPTVTFPGGYCSKACTGEVDGECGPTAGCVTTSMSGGMTTVQLRYCAPPCSRDDECRMGDGYRCQILFAGFGWCAPP